MRRFTRLLALSLSLLLLLMSAPAFAAQTVDSALLKQAASSVKMYQKAGSGSVLLTLKSGDVVFAGAVSGKYTLCTSGSKQGYIETRKLKDATSSATGNGIAVAKEAVTLYEEASTGSKKLATAKTGAVFSILCEGKDFTAVRQGATIGCVPTASLTIYNSASAAAGYAIAKKSASIVSDGTKSSKKLASVSASELVTVLYKLTNTTSIVRKSKTVGLMNMSNSELYPAKPVSTVQAAASATVYNGASTKLSKAGSLKKGASAQKLGEYGSYTLILLGDTAGCVATKSLKAASAQDAAADTSSAASSVSTGAVNSEYIQVLINTPMRTKPSASGPIVEYIAPGAIMKNLGASNDGGWVIINYGGYDLYVKSGDVTQSSFKTPSISSYDSDAIALVNEVNAYRKAAGLNALSVNPLLMRAAMQRCSEITKVFGHTRPNGENCNTVDPYNMWGENIAKGSPLSDAASAADAFMGSPEHKDNAMRAKFKSTGTCAMKVGNVYYWVQVFGY